MKSIKLLEDEKEIENIFTQARKNKSIRLRISDFDLEKLKEKADSEGVPYQTLTSSVLHKYVTNQFVEKDQVLKTFKLLTER